MPGGAGVIGTTLGLVRRIARIPPREMLTTLRAFVTLLVVEALIRWVRLPRLASMLGVRIDTTSTPGQFDRERDGLPNAAHRAWRSTKRVTRWWPFSDGPCLRRSLVAGSLIRGLDPAIRMGVASVDGQFGAHAWLEVGGVPMEEVSDYLPFAAGSGPARAATDRQVAR